MVEDKLEINEKNFLGWVKLFMEVAPLTKEDKFTIKRYLKRRDVATRRKEINNAFGVLPEEE